MIKKWLINFSNEPNLQVSVYFSFLLKNRIFGESTERLMVLSWFRWEQHNNNNILWHHTGNHARKVPRWVLQLGTNRGNEKKYITKNKLLVPYDSTKNLFYFSRRSSLRPIRGRATSSEVGTWFCSIRVSCTSRQLFPSSFFNISTQFIY